MSIGTKAACIPRLSSTSAASWNGDCDRCEHCPAAMVTLNSTTVAARADQSLHLTGGRTLIHLQGADKARPRRPLSRRARRPPEHWSAAPKDWPEAHRRTDRHRSGQTTVGAATV